MTPRTKRIRPSIAAQPEFLPMTRPEMDRLGWDELDVLLITGDAYVDHPAFGTALLGRWLVAHGYRVGVVSQPQWNQPDDVLRLGRPRLFAGVTAGALDSMLAHYTAFRRKRNDDAYTPGGRAGARPNRACIVYANLVKQAFPGLPVVLGGIEASLRRTTHYDFWVDRIRRSILLDSKADLLIYGMGERAILETARRLSQAQDRSDAAPDTRLHLIPGTVFIGQIEEIDPAAEINYLPSHEEIESDAAQLMNATLALERHVQKGAAWAVQPTGDRMVVVAPPSSPLTTEELDALYGLPFTRLPHPSYTQPIPAMDMIAFSLTSHRGCGGGCSFCSLALHQGRTIRSRSAESILQEATRLTRLPGWKGSVSDVGGPSANMWGAMCTHDPGRCRRSSCLFPRICRHFKPDQTAYLALLNRIRAVPGVRNVRVASGVRYDLGVQDPGFLAGFIAGFVGGQLKVAPEHISDCVVQLMRKPGLQVFQEFLNIFERESRGAGKEQYVTPYLMSAFPGCTDDDMRELAAWLRARSWRPQQVQCFVPTPGTVATAMYYAGIDPEGRPIHVARTDAERLRQHHILMPPVRPGASPRRSAEAPAAPTGTQKSAASPQQPKRPHRGGRRR